MKYLKRIFFTSIFVLLCSCSAMNSFLGIDDKGNKIDKNPPISYLTAVLKGLGPVGLIVSGLFTVGGAAYAGNARGQDRFASVVAGIQKVKKEMSKEDKVILVSKLKEHIPNKYHGAIARVKNTL